MKMGKRKPFDNILIAVDDKQKDYISFFMPSDDYWIYDTGEIERKDGKDFLKTRETNKGYLITDIQDDNHKTHTVSVHRIVAYVFLKKTPERNEVHHAGDKKDNRPSQLVWASPEEHAILDKLKNTNKQEHRKLFNAIKKDNRERGKYGE